MEWVDKISITSCCLKVSGQILRTKFTTEGEIDVSISKNILKHNLRQTVQVDDCRLRTTKYCATAYPCVLSYYFIQDIDPFIRSSNVILHALTNRASTQMQYVRTTDKKIFFANVHVFYFMSVFCVYFVLFTVL